MRLLSAVATTWMSPRQTGRTVNVAHRGASGYVAENTLAAMRRAIALDVDMVEVDVQRSKDGALVLMHDTTLLRTTNVSQVFPGRTPWRVADFTYEELMRLDAGRWKSPDFEGERIPTLDEAIAVVRGSRARLLLELKAPRLYPGIVADILGSLRDAAGYAGSAATEVRLVVQSFDFAAMKELKTHEPTVPVGLLGTPSRANLPALGTWADQVNPHHHSIDRAYVDKVHRAGMGCFVWTVNRGPAMRRALRMGVDGVITNRPDVLGRVLGKAVGAGCDSPVRSTAVNSAN